MAETSGPRPVRAARGTTLTCKGWVQEAALRMLMNNLDPEVAERPDDLVVYGGTGKAARSWEAFDRIVASLRDLGDDETLLIQSGKPEILQRHGVPEVPSERAGPDTKRLKVETLKKLRILPAAGGGGNEV